MGCGASKNDTVETIRPKKETEKASPSREEKGLESFNIGSSLSRPMLPRIQNSAAKAAVQFDITWSAENLSDSICSPASKLSLPKLTLSDNDIKAKLSDFEARWKDLDAAKLRKRGDKPRLKSHKPIGTDLAALKKRLEEKEIAAKANRDREIKKLQMKLAKQEEHAKKVLERKRALGALSNEELRLSWGGENGENLAEPSDHSDIIENGMGGHRTGSGRSNFTNSTENTATDDSVDQSVSNSMKSTTSSEQPVARVVRL